MFIHCQKNRFALRPFLVVYLSLSVHGTIFTLLKRYVQTQYDHSTWVRLLEVSGLTAADFDHKHVYPDEHMYRLVGEAATMTGLSADELHEKFGEYLVPDLMYMYQRLLQPEWNTLDMLEHTENTMHRQVRQEHADNAPPVLNVTRVSPDELLIDYVSKRRMGGLAVGIVRGVAAYYDEADQIEVEPVTSENGEKVRIRVWRVRK
ncbi:heme NO-binding domain-containing protein [Hymenobacter endophyticus]|uniref:Heme NO-binding domain-containing protein n=1 Tax=Hymenobacter endophyticus TaxID=3076335 RepID=A0ABU3TC74_9BACT|nr:heme NO-binding domain-containing protein [Hymenobacter endophyticus]MDU0368971.1 heme NO-binding domain-containing protein [Hymenobacter endophyticus]